MLKKITSLILTVSLCIGSVFTAYAEKKVEIKSVLVMGDSISTGFGLSGYEYDSDSTESYANLLKSDLNPESFKNIAINGQTSTQMLESLRSGNMNKDIEDADLILVSIGGNDLLSQLKSILKLIVIDDNGKLNIDIKDKESIKDAIKNISYENNKEKYDAIISLFRNNFENITQEIRTLNPDARIYFQTIYNPFSGISYLSEFDKLGQKLTDEFNKVIKDNCNDNIKCIDVASQYYNKAYEYTNILRLDIHPNYIGHRVIYRMIMSDLLDKPLDLSTVFEEGLVSYADGKPVMIEIKESKENTFSPGLNNILALVISAVTVIGGSVLVVVIRNKKSSE